jgi:hypothetical protein
MLNDSKHDVTKHIRKCIPHKKPLFYPSDIFYYLLLFFRAHCNYIVVFDFIATTALAFASIYLSIHTTSDFHLHLVAICGLAVFSLFTVCRLFVYCRRQITISDINNDNIRLVLLRIAEDIGPKNTFKGRVTLFQEDRIHKSMLVEQVRYDSSGVHITNNKCYYPRNVGIIGVARELPNCFHAHTLPHFISREQMEQYCRNELAIPKWITDRMSDYMIDVKTIVAYGLQTSNGVSLGVVSIDMLNELAPREPGHLENLMRHLGDCIINIKMRNSK